MHLKMVILFGVLLGMQLSGYAQSKQGSTGVRLEPMFGLDYNRSANVSYQPMPMDARRLCPDLQQGSYWTVAHVHRNDAEYFVLLGVQPGARGHSFGTSIEIRGSKCRHDESRWTLSGFVPSDGYRESVETLPGLGAEPICNKQPLEDCHYLLRSAAEESLLRELVQDALRRGAGAWGAAEFRKAVCSPDILEDNSFKPVVHEELSKFCTQPR
jgi:hypothetical protein